MIINDIDLGGSHPWAAPIVGQSTGVAVIEGIETITWARGSILRKQTVDFYLQAWYSIGGAAAMSMQAAQYLVKQVEEMASNKFYQPCYIQWTNTAQLNQPLATSELHDGWYVIEDFEPNYQDYILNGIVKCTMTVSEVAPQSPRRMALSYMGGTLSSNFTGSSASANLITLPLASTAGEASFNRTGAEGTLVSVLSPAASPEPFVPSGTISSFFDGGVRVYDTINTTSNPVPTATSSSYVNSNWVEVRFTDHDFKGDCVLTNGLILMLFQKGANPISTCYLWNTSASTVGWQQFAKLDSLVSSTATLDSYSLQVVSPDECSLVTVSGPAAGGSLIAHNIRMQRGRYDVRVAVTPLSGAFASGQVVVLTTPAPAKFGYSHVYGLDPTLDTSTTVSPNLGFAGAFIASTTYPFVTGFLYQNQPTGSQLMAATSGGGVAIGDSASLSTNATRQYGIFALPYGVTGSYSPANLQAEAESGTLGTGWATTTDNAASASSAARAASGTTALSNDTWGTAFAPEAGSYDGFFRLKVSSTASTVNQMTVGVWDATAGAYAASQTYSPALLGSAGTSYVFVNTGIFTPTAGHNLQFRATIAATLATNWFIDEGFLAPRILGAGNRGPQDIWLQFIYDRSTRVVRV